ncbi:hypothetical protein D0Z07_2973 [Hyphodiscus hymeniophilus]|uniref:Uncharacterized protein n=1 Tax=Hyphodiscus hymeniophilus TaxID=353542 RepID=A0A9P7AYH4_9HELO|nr:hypothetical protein D0Z07_2973 [Hyphodiscus hymeniophilus]
MSFISTLRNPAVFGVFNLFGLAGSTYLLRSHMIELSEDHEARMVRLSHMSLMDELEGTLRGHIGLIEEALDRIEGKGTEADRGKKMNEYYGKRARDEKAR